MSAWEIAKFVVQLLFIVLFIVQIVLLTRKNSKAVTAIEIMQCALGAAGTVLAFSNLKL